MCVYGGWSAAIAKLFLVLYDFAFYWSFVGIMKYKSAWPWTHWYFMTDCHSTSHVIMCVYFYQFDQPNYLDPALVKDYLIRLNIFGL